MNHLIGQSQLLGWTAGKTLLLFVLAVIGLRLAERRTLAQLNAFDWVVTVTVGAIIGRTSTSSQTSFLTGVVALTTVLIAHRLLAILRWHGWLGRLLDRRPLLLIEHGQLQTAALRTAGLTERDVLRLLRESGADDPDMLDHVLYEDGGTITISKPDSPVGRAFQAGLDEARQAPRKPDR